MTRETFDRFLAWLSEDRDEAALRYEGIRRKLIKFFEWRRCAFPEDHADEVLDRVTRKLSEGAVIHVSPENYCFGVAQFVAREALSRPAAVAMDLAALTAPSSKESDEVRLNCLERCLGMLPGGDRRLVERFYVGKGREKINNRLRLAGELSVSVPTLRVRVHRVRLKLENCVSDCLKRQEDAVTKPGDRP